MHFWRSLLTTSAGMLYATLLQATTFDITPDTKMVGENFTVKVEYNDTFATIARRHDVGYYELVDANPHVDPWQPEDGTEVLIPNQFILPQGARNGIIVNLAELRLYYYATDGKTVTTLPIGIGTEMWPTPLTKGVIVSKTKNPSWIVPESIMREHEERGDYLPAVVPPGPDNPLGDYKMKLSIPGYMIHGTNRPEGIGRRITHGCMRMYPEDIENLFNQVSVNTPVHIIHAPVKEAWVDNTLYIEMHTPLPEYPQGKKDLIGQLMTLMYAEGPGGNFQVDWAKVRAIAKNANGIPTPVGGLYQHVSADEDRASASASASENTSTEQTDDNEDIY